MEHERIRLGIFAPLKKAYSQTFVDAHVNLIDAHISYYTGKPIPDSLDGHSPIQSLFKKGVNYLVGNLKGDKSFYLRRALEASIMKQKIDAAFVEFGTLAQKVYPIFVKRNIPFIVHFHGYDASVNEVIEKNNNYKEVFLYASRVIVVSNLMKFRLVELGCPEEKLVVTPCGPNDSFLKIKPSFKEEQFIAIGRFVDKKAPYYLVLAFKEVVNKYPEARLIIAGDGPLYNTTQNLILHFGLGNNIELVGVISPEEFRNYLRNSIGFVQHSITAKNGDMEGMPVAITEASAAGLPVVSTKHAGIPEVILDGHSGLLVDEHDVHGMGDALVNIIEDRDRAKKLGAAGKRRITERFTMKHHIDTIDAVIRESLAGS